MNEELRRRLDQIDEWLCDSAHGYELGNVLSAVRGPDSGRDDVKYSQTVVIRTAAFPKLARMDRHPTGWVMAPPDKKLGGIYDESDHFNQHIYRAGEVLGLIEDKGDG